MLIFNLLFDKHNFVWELLIYTEMTHATETFLTEEKTPYAYLALLLHEVIQ